jgi:uncharacterized glyoxalase superfamily protein PhnB
MITKTAAPVFQVASVDAALQHYTEVLGFEEDFRVGEYAGVKLGGIHVHLSKHVGGEYAKPIGGSIVYVFCDEVDSYYAEVQKKGARVKYPPHATSYGMREFMVADLDGHHLAFGCETQKAQQER